jgi:hypothetical protein
MGNGATLEPACTVVSFTGIYKRGGMAKREIERGESRRCVSSEIAYLEGQVTEGRQVAVAHQGQDASILHL